MYQEWDLEMYSSLILNYFLNMAENKLHFVEGASIHGLPMFSGINYPF